MHTGLLKEEEGEHPCEAEKRACKGRGLKVYMAPQEQRGISCGQQVIKGQEEAERGAGGSAPRVLCPSEGVCFDSVRRLEDFLSKTGK